MAEPVGERVRRYILDGSDEDLRRLLSIAETTREMAAAVGGPFDLAYTRLFLMHQPDPVRTLSQIAGLLRPGGRVVAQEALRSPPPRSHPHLGALVSRSARSSVIADQCSHFETRTLNLRVILLQP
jgi:SAM-dependent methyltransferase